MTLMNVNNKSKPAMLATFVVLVGLVSIVFSHPVQAQTFFGPGCISIGMDCNHNHQENHGKGLSGIKGGDGIKGDTGANGNTEAQGAKGLQGLAGADVNANGANANGGDTHSNNGNANSG
jgi:hypothetical protein